jgi:RING finger protein 121
MEPKQAEVHDEDMIPHGNHAHTRAETVANASYIFHVIFISMIATQIGLYFWKQKHPSSFQKFSVLGLWIIPCVWSLNVEVPFTRMVTIWSVYSFCTGYIVFLATRTPLARSTPRIVYQWFYLLYRFWMVVAMAGYAIMMCHFFAFTLLFPTIFGVLNAELAFLLLFYGLYYGVLSRCFAFYFGHRILIIVIVVVVNLFRRDLAILCAASLASRLSPFSSDGLPIKQIPNNICAVCNEELYSIRLDQEIPTKEAMFELACGQF